MERTHVTSPKPVNLYKLYDLSTLPAKTIYTYPAKYTITASFIGPDNKPYNAEFIFSINHTDK